MEQLIDLRGKNAIVTGGSRGVGRATALLFARAGASVGIAYHSRGDAAREVVSQVQSLGVDGWAEQGDLTIAKDAAKLFERADREFDGLDFFVANAGVWPPSPVPIAEMSDEQWHDTMKTNLDSVFYTCRESARRLRGDGAIVLVSSTAGQRGEAFHADYAATKGALVSLVKGFSGELAPRGIRANAVAPGWIDTEMAEPAFGNGGRDEICRTIPLRRIATAEDVAGPIVFLCSTLARHITGEILNVNGGAVLVG